MQFALLGEIQFELITYFDGLDGRFGADYAEHALIEGKPRIQWIGDKLDEWTIKLKFHRAYCDPAKEIARLQAALKAHQALPFVLANGEYKGEFVVTELSVTTEQTDPSGTLVALEASLALKEHVPPPGVERAKPAAPAVKAAGKPAMPQVEKALASVTSGKSPLAGVRSAIGQALGVLKTAVSAYQVAKETVAAVKQLVRNPLAALDRLDKVLPKLTELGVNTAALGDVLMQARVVTEDAKTAINMARQIGEELKNTRMILTGVSIKNLPMRLKDLDGSLGKIDESISGLGTSLTKLAAKVAVRSTPEEGQ